MQVTFLGHVGMYIETAHGSVLCDPLFNSAYFGSWWTFPANDQLDFSPYVNPDYLFISHTHLDHFDEDFLRGHVSKETTVLLPDHPLGLVEKWLRELGFVNFIQTRNAVPIDLDGLKVMIPSLVSPADGPLGDSGLCLDDGEVRIFNQNDSRPVHFGELEAFGPFDVHFLQYSGAIWYPMVYRFPQKMKDALSSKKRVTQMERALRYAKLIGAPHIVPSAGPPCFLDDGLWRLNDFDRDPNNIFPDQTVFMELVEEAGFTTPHLLIPGSVMTIAPGAQVETRHPMPDDEVMAIFTDKRSHLEAYKARKQPELDAILASLPRGEVEIHPALKAWFEPILEIADQTCLGIDDSLLLELGEGGQVVIDFVNREVREWDGVSPNRYVFHIPRELVEYCILNHEEDWVNHIFLSCRFEAERKGTYNEFLYSFFKCLSIERIQYAEGYYVEQRPDQQTIEVDGYMIQRRCPHLKADLERFGEVDDGILTCTLHGWQFELASGRCLTMDDRKLYSKKSSPPSPEPPMATDPRDAALGEPRLHHTGIVVHDLAAAAASYERLGFRDGERFEVPAQGIVAIVYHAGPGYMELIQPTDPEGAIARYMAKRGEGVHHVAYAVDDLDATLARLKTAGVRLIDEVPRTGAHGWRIAFIHPESCHGVLTELVQE